MGRRFVFAEEVFEEFRYSTSTNNVNFANDIFVTAGRPFIAGQNWHVIIDPGVVIGSTAELSYAATTGVFPRVLKLSVYGQIVGKGGAGGNGGRDGDSKGGGTGGGGGGGAGSPAGTAGAAGTDQALSQAGAGTVFSGGVDGQGNFWNVFQSPGGNQSATSGGHGGYCMYLDVDTRIFVYEGGLLAAGGGGGGGASPQGAQIGDPRRWGGAGGGPGAAGMQGGDGSTGRGQGGGAGGAGGNTKNAFNGPGTATILKGRAYGLDYP